MSVSYTHLAEADYVVRIPMAHGVDSLNVATAAAVAFWQLRILSLIHILETLP